MQRGKFPGFVLLLMLSSLLSFAPFVWDLDTPVKILGAILIVIGLIWVAVAAVSG
jgi:hypothetical protein